MIDFDKAFDRLIGHEGGYTNNPADDGNWTGGKQGRGILQGTKYGIAASSYPYLTIKDLTVEKAKEIYYRDYWQLIGKAHPAIKFQLFDAAVNHGHGNAIRMLQKAVGVTDDGWWGSNSQAALDKEDHNDILMRFLGYRLKFWASLTKFTEFGRGWTIRGAENLILAAEDN